MVLELDPENKGISIQTEFPCYSIQFQDESNLKKALEKMINSQGVGARQLWGALSLELWHRNFIDNG